MGGVGGLAPVGGPLARILDRERGGDDDDLVGAAEPVGLEHHPAEARVDRERRQPPSQRVEALAVERPELGQQRDPVADLAAVGRVEEAGSRSTSPSPGAAI